jgi:carbon-monoxide dehydrogenase medium subunit
MKPPIFDFVSPGSLQEALALLAAGDGDAKLVAGGQSLVPMLNFRLLNPSLLIDVSRLAELREIREDADYLGIGAATRHHELEMSPVVTKHFPVLSAAMRHVAHLAIRNKGTIGGSLCHGDPAAELPMMIRLLDARLVVQGPEGERIVEAADFYLAALTPDIAENEILVDVRLPYLSPNTGWGFEEFARKSGDFALAGAAALIKADDGRITEARISLMGVDETPLRAAEAEEMLVGNALEPALGEQVCKSAQDLVNPNSDLHASADYRRHLIGAMTGRALDAAWRQATGDAYA